MSKEIIGYRVNSNNCAMPVYAPAKGAIVTQALIMCFICDKTVYHCMGPGRKIMCIHCHEHNLPLLVKPYDPRI